MYFSWGRIVRFACFTALFGYCMFGCLNFGLIGFWFACIWVCLDFGFAAAFGLGFDFVFGLSVAVGCVI